MSGGGTKTSATESRRREEARTAASHIPALPPGTRTTDGSSVAAGHSPQANQRREQIQVRHEVDQDREVHQDVVRLLDRRRCRR